jgi:hypothetical protein
MEVRCELIVCAVNGSDDVDVSLIIEDHPSDTTKVNLRFNDQLLTLYASELRKAIENATNTE